jgi:hypothetical protein
MKHTIILRDVLVGDVYQTFVFVDEERLYEDGELTDNCLQEILNKLGVDAEVIHDNEKPFGKKHIVQLHGIWSDDELDLNVEVFVDDEKVSNNGFYTENCLEEIIAKLEIDAEVVYETETEITNYVIKRRNRNKN